MRTSAACSTRRPRSSRASRPTTPTTRPCGSAPCWAWPTGPGVDKLVLGDKGSGIPGFGDWAEQLIAESTGKDGKGILPVVVPSLDAPNFDPSTPDEVLATIGAGVHMDALPASGWGVAVDAPLGAQMLLWEYATAVAGRIIGINPFDQPDVESAKQAARDMLEGAGDSPTPAFTDGPVEVYATEGLLTDESTVADAVATLLGQIDGEHGYLAVMAYLDRAREAHLAHVREHLAERTGRPTTFGWGPRFLHSTGQYHKGGPPTGVYLQVTGEPRAGPRDPGSAVHLRRLHRRAGHRRRLRPRRPRASRAPAAPHRPEGRPGRAPGDPQVTHDRQPARVMDQPAAGPRRPSAARASPAPAAWCCSASPVTWRARR